MVCMQISWNPSTIDIDDCDKGGGSHTSTLKKQTKYQREIKSLGASEKSNYHYEYLLPPPLHPPIFLSPPLTPPLSLPPPSPHRHRGGSQCQPTKAANKRPKRSEKGFWVREKSFLFTEYLVPFVAPPFSCSCILKWINHYLTISMVVLGNIVD